MRTLLAVGIAGTFGGLLAALWPAIPGDVADRRARWAAVAPANYSIEVRARCFCAGDGVWYRVRVRDGVPVAQVALDTIRRPNDAEPPMRSVDSLYALIERTLDGPAGRPMELRVRYDPTWHYPRSIAADLSLSYDDEFLIEARNLTLLPVADADTARDEHRPATR